MAHTEHEPENIIPQKPPPPPRREGDPAERPAVDPQAPTEPGQRHPVQTPIEQPPTQPIAPRVAAPAPSSRRGSRKPSGHIAIPHMPDIDPIVIGQGGGRERAKSDPLILVDYPSRARPSTGAAALPAYSR